MLQNARDSSDQLVTADSRLVKNFHCLVLSFFSDRGRFFLRNLSVTLERGVTSLFSSPTRHLWRNFKKIFNIGSTENKIIEVNRILK